VTANGRDATAMELGMTAIASVCRADSSFKQEDGDPLDIEEAVDYDTEVLQSFLPALEWPVKSCVEGHPS
jgi:hypothetical protein